MPSTEPFAAGGYRFIPFQFQYSGGVVAEPGFRIERARFRRPLPLAQGFDAVEAYLGALGRPPTAFCACELRSPAQFTEAGFIAFNRSYVERLAAWGIFPHRCQTLDELLDNMRHVTENLKEFTATIKTRPHTLIRASNPREHKTGEQQ